MLSNIADRIGPQTHDYAACSLMGLFTFMTAMADSLLELQILRFLTGIGLGGVIPGINSLTAEYSPAKRRALPDDLDVFRFWL